MKSKHETTSLTRLRFAGCYGRGHRIWPIYKLAVSSNHSKIFSRNFFGRYCLRTAELSNSRPPFSRIFIFANVKKLSRRMFDSFCSLQWRFGHVISLYRKSVHRIYKSSNIKQHNRNTINNYCLSMWLIIADLFECIKLKEKFSS